MKILVVNAGSSSLKYQLIDMTNESVVCKGGVERVGMGGSKLSHSLVLSSVEVKKVEIVEDLSNHTEALALVINTIVNKDHGGIKSIDEIGAVGHRILHTGEDFTCSVSITKENLCIMEKNIPLGPLHMPANLDCVKSCMNILPGVPNVAVFDTAFHMTMPQKAFMYAIKYEDYEKYKVRRYGFHGTSHKFVSQIAVKLLGKPNSKIVTCHLGNGSSVAAVVDGKCIDTSMGLTPLEGLMMGTRSGDIDPACLEFLMDKKGYDIHQMLNYLNKECGFKGVSEYSSDARDIGCAAEMGNEKAQLVADMFSYRVKKYIGSYAAAMGGLDAIVFTGGIGENSDYNRANIMRDMDWIGIDFDWDKNKERTGKIAELTKEGSKVKVFVIPTNEELVIARETMDIVGK